MYTSKTQGSIAYCNMQRFITCLLQVSRICGCVLEAGLPEKEVVLLVTKGQACRIRLLSSFSSTHKCVRGCKVR